MIILEKKVQAMNDAIIDIVNNYIQLIRKEYKVEAVYLFGSYAKGTNTDDSDIDVAIVLENYLDKMDMLLELLKLTKYVDLRIEPHPIKLDEFKK
jgi:predicted nucleotidyltransferase